jgi:hypothetical protein
MENVEKLMNQGRKLVVENLKWAAAQAEQAATDFERVSERHAVDAKRAVEATQEAVEAARTQQEAMVKRVSETVTKTVDLWRDALQGAKA